MNAADKIYDLARGLLVDLGDTADQVRDRLFALGITGVKGQCRRCPLANYLIDANLPGVKAVRVELDHVSFELADGTSVEVPLPDACALFVQRFDTTDMYDGLLPAEVTP